MRPFLVIFAAAAAASYFFLLFRVSAFRVDQPSRGYFGRPLDVLSLHQLFRPELYSAPGQRLLPWLRAAVWLFAISGTLGFAALAGLLGP